MSECPVCVSVCACVCIHLRLCPKSRNESCLEKKKKKKLLFLTDLQGFIEIDGCVCTSEYDRVCVCVLVCVKTQRWLTIIPSIIDWCLFCVSGFVHFHFGSDSDPESYP